MGLIETIDSRLTNIETLLLDLVNTKQPIATKEPSEEILDIKQAGELLHLAIPTLYSMVSERRIPFSKKGKKLMFLKSELLHWVKGGQRKTVSELQTEADDFVHGKGKRKQRKPVAV